MRQLLIFLILLLANRTFVLGQQAPVQTPGEMHMQPPTPAADININAEKDVNIDATTNKQVATPPDSTTSQPRVWATIEIVLSVAMLVFGMLVFALQTYLIVKLNLQWTPTSILRFQGLTLIIVGSILLIVAGYSNQQILPVIGLFGTIAGYLLGATEKNEAKPVT